MSETATRGSLDRGGLDRGGPDRGGLGRAATSGVLWLFAQSVGARLIGFGSQLLLAAVLMPTDFGVIGLANTVAGIAQALVSFGVDDVLLQRQRTVRLWSAPAFWISLGLGTLGGALMIAAAPLAGIAYHSRSLVWLIVILAVAMPIRTLATVPQVSIRLAMGFRFLAAYNLFEIAALQLGTVALAAAGLGAFSFAIPVPLVAAAKAALFWRRAAPPVRRRLRTVQVRYVFGRSSLVFLSRIIIEVVNQGDYIVLGLSAPHAVVGLYYFAFRFSAQPVRMLASNFNNVLFPAFAQLRGDPARQAAAALRASRLLSYLVVPFCFLQAALAEPGLQLLFGRRWLGAVPMVELLSLGLPFDAVSWITGSLLSARREFGRSLRFAAVSMLVFFAAVIAGARLDGAIGVAAGVVVYYAAYPPVCSILVFRSAGIRTAAVLELYLVPLLLAAAAMGAAYWLSLVPGLRHDDLVRCVVIGGAGPAFYAAAVFVVRREIFDETVARFAGIAARLRKRSGRGAPAVPMSRPSPDSASRSPERIVTR